MPRCDSRRIPLPSGRTVYSTAERADWLTWSKGPITRVTTMRRPFGVQPGSCTPAQGLAQRTGTMCSPRPVAPTRPTTAKIGPLDRSRWNATGEPSGEMTALISTAFGPGWVSARRPLPSGRADTSRADENRSFRTCVHTIRPACPPPGDAGVAACAGPASAGVAPARPPVTTVRPPASKTATPNLAAAASQPPRLMIAKNRPEAYSDDNMPPHGYMPSRDEQDRKLVTELVAIFLPERYEPTAERCPAGTPRLRASDTCARSPAASAPSSGYR